MVNVYVGVLQAYMYIEGVQSTTIAAIAEAQS